MRAARAVGGPLAVLVAAGAATASVSRYDLRIVVVYAVLSAALVVSLVQDLRGARRARRGRADGAEGGPAGAETGAGGWGPRAAFGVLCTAAVVTWLAPTFTYLDADAARVVKVVLSGSAVAAGGVLLSGLRHRAAVAMALGVAGHVSAAVLLIHGDPAPRIDVWVMLQQAADGLAHGQNMYAQTWTGSPGVQDAFTYLPWMGVLLAPGRWLAGDVRWALLVVTVAAAVTPWWAAHRGRLRGGTDADGVAVTGLSCLVLLLPGTATQVEQAWTEPVLLACLVGWYVATLRGRRAASVLALGLGLACKQHVWPLLVVIASWRRFGARRTLAAAGVAVALMSPWALAGPGAMWHDTVTLLVRFRALLFADTLYIAAIHELGWTPPLAVTGLVLLGALGYAAVAVRRLDPAPGVVLRVVATVLLIANLVNKQAFYNQYWLVMTLLLVSWMPLPVSREPGDADATDSVRGPGRPRAGAPA